jgi:FkbM family methyltransferase
LNRSAAVARVNHRNIGWVTPLRIMPSIDPVGAAIRLSGSISPRARARLDLARQRRMGDFAVRVTEELVRPGDVAIDVGARWGTYTSLLMRLVGPTGVVHAFEPNPDHAEALRAIVGRHLNAYFHSVALSDDSGETDLHVPLLSGEAADGLASLNRPATVHHTVRISRRRLDDVGLVRVDFVKCDVEGHELAVLRGAKETFGTLHPTVLIEVEQRHRGADVGQTLAYFDSLGYVGYAVHKDGLRPAEAFSLERDQVRPLEAPRLGSSWMMPLDYIHDFLFVTPGTNLDNLAAT